MIQGTGQLADAYGRMFIQWSIAGTPMNDEAESGDACLVQACAAGVLVAAIDGAGPGAEAASAARIAEATLRAHADESPISLVLRCHEGLRKTRGAVMTLAFCHHRDRTITWLGVGNVDAVLFHAGPTGATSDRVVLRGGVVGYQLPALRAEVLPIRTLDVLIMATDGIEEHFADTVDIRREPRSLADGILATHRKGTDDALVVVAKYHGADES